MKNKNQEIQSHQKNKSQKRRADQAFNGQDNSQRNEKEPKHKRRAETIENVLAFLDEGFLPVSSSKVTVRYDTQSEGPSVNKKFIPNRIDKQSHKLFMKIFSSDYWELLSSIICVNLEKKSNSYQRITRCTTTQPMQPRL